MNEPESGVETLNWRTLRLTGTAELHYQSTTSLIITQLGGHSVLGVSKKSRTCRIRSLKFFHYDQMRNRAPFGVVVKTRDSQSGKPSSIPGASDGQPNRIGSCPPLGAAKVKRRRRGDKRHCQMPRLLRSGGHPNLPLPYDHCRVCDYL